MSDGSAQADSAPNYRSSLATAHAVIIAISRRSRELRSEQEVLKAIFEAQPSSKHMYLEAMNRAGHFVFYHQLQQLFEFGKSQDRIEAAHEFCAACGQIFLEYAFADSIHQVLQMAMAKTSEFQTTALEMFQHQFHNYAGEKFSFELVVSKKEIQAVLSYRHPEKMQQYLASYGLDPELGFRNSFEFIGGALEGCCAKTVADYESSKFKMVLDGQVGSYHLPISESGSFDTEKLVATLLRHITDLKEKQLADQACERLASDLIIDSPLMRETWDRIRRAGNSAEIVLLRGESGTGKSFIARKIHENSPRREQPFVEVGLTADIGSENLIQSDLFGHERGAFTGAHAQKPGLFSLADGGTIFLDEVGDASPELQAKLLRVLESSTFRRLGGTEDISVDMRVILATNRDLEAMVRDGLFRQDLYYRINVIPIVLPPLRDRREEIPALAEFLLARSQARGKSPSIQLADGLAQQLREYDWPGNIRELDHALRYANAMAKKDSILVSDLPEAVGTVLSHLPPKTEDSDRSRSISEQAAGEDLPVVNLENLRYHVRNTKPLQHEAEAEHEWPAHIEHAKRHWLILLIDECGGDLAMIARFWDRSSERTLRKLIRSYGLSEHLASARRRPR